MIEIIVQVSQIRENLKKYGDWLEKFDGRIFNGFNAIFNALTLTLELLDYYYNVWSSYDTSKLSPEEVERRRRENAERVIEVTKWAFVHAMSIIEFSIKNAVKIIDSSILKSIEVRKCRGSKCRRVRIYLRDIVREFKEMRCLSDEVYGNWVSLIDIRNAIVHNNAIADEDKVLRVGDMEIRLKEGQMLKGELGFFVKLIDYAVENYRYTMEALPSCKPR